MSWVFAAISRNPIPSDLKAKFQSIHTREKYLSEQPNVYIASNGPELTTCCHIDHPATDSGYIILGSPLWAVGNDYHFLTREDWDKFSWAEPEINRLESYYALLRWQGTQFQCWTDLIGLRDFLVVETAWGYVITTRLDWALKVLDTRSFNNEALGAHIITGANLGQDTIIQGIKRIYRGMSASISPTDCVIRKAPANETKPNIFDRDELHADMMKRVLLPYKEGRRLSMALSGGIDSRTVISFLLNPDAQKYRPLWDAHTIGADCEADMKSAIQIAQEMNIKHTKYVPDLLPVPELWEYVRENSLAMRMDLFPSETNRYRFVNDLAAKYNGVIDGGSGWVLRYNEFRAMAIKQKKDILNGNWDKILPNLVRNTSFFFTGDIQKEMDSQMRTRSLAMLSRLPKASEIGLYNWLNLLYTEIWLPYFYSSHQIWTDNIYQDYMPNMSHVFMKNALQISQKEKLNNQLCYYFIRKNRKELLHIPRTAYSLQLPCQTHTAAWAIYARIHHKLIPKKTFNYDVQLLQHLREPVLDRLNSNEVKQYKGYDWKLLSKNIEEFYAGNTENAFWIDHWLRFDFWRELVQG